MHPSAHGLGDVPASPIGPAASPAEADLTLRRRSRRHTPPEVTTSATVHPPAHAIGGVPASVSRPIAIAPSPLAPAFASSPRVVATSASRTTGKRRPQRHRCSVCAKCFPYPSDLATHSRFHTGDRPFKCDYCGKAFTQKGDLQKHHRIHTGDRPFKCEYCDKAFAHKVSLQAHHSIHTGVRPFECDYCGRGFTRRSDVKTHLRVHTRERPFRCDECGLTSISSSNLYKHMRRVHGVEPVGKPRPSELTSVKYK